MSDKESRPLLDIAIEQEEWELAALCLMLGVLEAARKYPEEALEALLDELELEAGISGSGQANPDRRGHRGSRAQEKRERHGRV